MWRFCLPKPSSVTTYTSFYLQKPVYLYQSLLEYSRITCRVVILHRPGICLRQLPITIEVSWNIDIVPLSVVEQNLFRSRHEHPYLYIVSTYVFNHTPEVCFCERPFYFAERWKEKYIECLDEIIVLDWTIPILPVQEPPFEIVRFHQSVRSHPDISEYFSLTNIPVMENVLNEILKPILPDNVISIIGGLIHPQLFTRPDILFSLHGNNNLDDASNTVLLNSVSTSCYRINVTICKSYLHYYCGSVSDYPCATIYNNTKIILIREDNDLQVMGPFDSLEDFRSYVIENRITGIF